MNRVELAFRTFFWIFSRNHLQKKSRLLKHQLRKLWNTRVTESGREKGRNDAVQIRLAVEGRLMTFKEPIDTYSDAQIGAAVGMSIEIVRLFCKESLISSPL